MLGLGLMGGSLALALRALADAPAVVGWSPSASEAATAHRRGALTGVVDDPERAAEGADLVVLATPLDAACELVGTVAGALGPGATLTDVVSLKAPLVDAVRRAGLTARWVGSHPMCGGERSGFEAARADLYRDASVWVVDDGAGSAHRARVEGLWKALGARPESIEAADHDARMARVSHLPQLTSNALALLLEDAGLLPDDLGPGGRDMTRLAGSSPTVWADLLAHAPADLPVALRDLADRLRSLADQVEAGDLDALGASMARSCAWRQRT